MIRKDIAEYEDSDSQLAKNTINKLNNKITNLEKIIALLKYEKIKEYIATFDYPENKKEEYEKAIKVIDDLRNIVRGDE